MVSGRTFFGSDGGKTAAVLRSFVTSCELAGCVDSQRLQFRMGFTLGAISERRAFLTTGLQTTREPVRAQYRPRACPDEPNRGYPIQYSEQSTIAVVSFVSGAAV